MLLRPYSILNGKPLPDMFFPDTAGLLALPYVAAYMKLQGAKISKTPEGELMVAYGGRETVKETVIGRVDDYNGLQLPQWWTGWKALEKGSDHKRGLKEMLEVARVTHAWPCIVQEHRPGMWRMVVLEVGIDKTFTYCMDCAGEASCPEIIDEVFYRWCPDGGRICLSCFEKRMGRQIIASDVRDVRANVVIRTLLERNN